MNPESVPAPKCLRCGTALAAAGLCPRCLMAEAMQPTGGDRAAGAPPLTLEELAPHFPQLEILECLGRGGMGVVYKARQKSLNRLVALKLLAPERADDPEFAARFEKEAHALAALNHPHIVAVHDFGQAGGFYYLLMEFVDGVNLRQLLQAKRLTPKEALSIVPPVCDALQCAHDRGIVHRDIKPENLLIDRTGVVKIADFGIAKIVERAGEPAPPHAAAPVSEGRATFPLGTPDYAAPEQQNGHADHRADIYSLGVVLYEMLTGERPKERIEAPSKRVQVDIRIDDIVLRALEKTPELRFATAAEFRTQVEAVASAREKEEDPDGGADYGGLLSAAWTMVPVVAVILAFFNPWGGQAWTWFAMGCVLLAILPALAVGSGRPHRVALAFSVVWWLSAFMTAFALVEMLGIGARQPVQNTFFGMLLAAPFIWLLAGHKAGSMEQNTTSSDQSWRSLQAWQYASVILSVLLAALLVVLLATPLFGGPRLPGKEMRLLIFITVIGAPACLWAAHVFSLARGGKRFLERWLPASWYEAMKAESQAWYLVCECGQATSVWDRGGVRYGAAGNPSKWLWCEACHRRRMHRTEWRGEGGPQNPVKGSAGALAMNAAVWVALTLAAVWVMFFVAVLRNDFGGARPAWLAGLLLATAPLVLAAFRGGWLRALAWSALFMGLPCIGLGGFFVFAMLAETGGWKPTPAEAFVVPLSCLGAVLLPLAGLVLWKVSRPVEASRSRGCGTAAGACAVVLFALFGLMFSLWFASRQRAVLPAQMQDHVATERASSVDHGHLANLAKHLAEYAQALQNMDDAGMRKQVEIGKRNLEHAAQTYGENHALTQEAREELKVVQAEMQRRSQAQPGDPGTADFSSFERSMDR